MEKTGSWEIFYKGKNNSDWRLNNPMDQVGPNGGMGVVQSGVDVSVEEHVPINQGEQRSRLSSPEEQSLEKFLTKAEKEWVKPVITERKIL